MEEHSAIYENLTETRLNSRYVLKSTAQSDLLAALTTAAVTGSSTSECTGSTSRLSQDQAVRKEEYEPHKYGRFF